MRKIFTLVITGAVFLALKSCLFGKTQVSPTPQDSSNLKTIYHLSVKKLDGGVIDFSSMKGKKILIVNTASECGYTPQYEGLQELQEKMGDKLIIIGCPCNQFGNQEPGDSTEIVSFCKKNYGVTFALTEKLDVKGSGQHPLYKWLTSKAENGVMDSEVKWNFNKFLIDEEGHLMAYFPSGVKPNDSQLIELINK